MPRARSRPRIISIGSRSIARAIFCARAARQLTAEMLTGGKSGTEAVDAWVKPRANEVERIRTSMHEIADTGLTLSKLSVAASLLGDLAGR